MNLRASFPFLMKYPSARKTTRHSTSPARTMIIILPVFIPIPSGWSIHQNPGRPLSGRWCQATERIVFTSR